MIETGRVVDSARVEERLLPLRGLNTSSRLRMYLRE